MTDDAKPIEFERLAELTAKSSEQRGTYISRQLTTADVLSLLASAHALESANARIAELEAYGATLAQQRQAALDSATDRAHLEEAAELLRRCEEIWFDDDNDLATHLRWIGRDQALRAKPSPDGEKERCAACGSYDKAERFEITAGAGDWCDAPWHVGLPRRPLRAPVIIGPDRDEPTVEPPLTSDWREKVLADVVLAAREAYAQNKGLWFFADQLERIAKGGAR